MVDPSQMGGPGGPPGGGAPPMPGAGAPPGADPAALLKRLFRSSSKHKRKGGKKRK